MKLLFIAAGFAGFASVALGAFGAHALKDTLTAHDGVQTWHTATLYQLVHAVAALAVVLAAQGAKYPAATQRLLHTAAACWLAGLIAFSGSLYWLALGGPKWLGPVTPLGGIALLGGWACAIAVGWRHRNPS